MGKPLRALIVDDSIDDAELLVYELVRAGYDISHERVDNADAMRDALQREQWDLVLSDYSMPTFSGPAALGVLHSTGLDVPFIIVSGTVGEETAIAALKAGAHDFLVKGRLARLQPAIDRELRDLVQRRERVRAEESLRRSEAQYRSLVEHAVFGMYWETLEGALVTVNPALVQMLGYPSSEELLHVGLAHVHSDPEVAADLARRRRDHGRIAGEEAMWRRHDGSVIRVRLSGRIIDEPTRMVFEGIVEDITERHRLQEQLRQSQKMEAVGQLAGGVAHDFNNMLTVILGYTELLTEQIGLDKPLGKDLREIQDAAQRAAALTRKLLAFSRKQVLTVAPVDLTKIVQSLEPMLRRLLEEPITIRTALADDLVTVMADSSQLEHLLVNLVVNARDAMPGGGALTITTGNADLDAAFVADNPGASVGSYAMMSVTDTGTGMAPEVRAKIFEPFFTTKEAGRGTGLGLAAVYGTVKQLGGFIAVDSHLGRGSTFTIYLPETDQRSVPLQIVPSSVASVGRETILMVEDESSVRAFARSALERFGYRVIAADSGEAALGLLDRSDESIDLLLTDVVLAGMNGRELADRATRRRPSLRILFMSGYASVLRSDNGYLVSGAELLEKPFTARALLVKTRQLLGAGRDERVLTDR
jgi:PAS domain S-box-containing protein